MTIPLTWDLIGERTYETGVDQGVLYIPNAAGVYDTGFAWNGLTNVSESPSGAEANKQYADNGVYVNLTSAEEFNATLEAFTYPDEFAVFDGQAVPTPGVTVGQQGRPSFGLSYRTKMGNDLLGSEYGYKLHLIYTCTAAPSEKSYATESDSPEAVPLSWELSTLGAPYAGGKPTSIVTVDSTAVAPADLAALEALLYGTGIIEPALPTPDELVALMTP